MAEVALVPRIALFHELQSAILSPYLDELELNLSSFQLLMAVHAAGDNASQAEIARRLGISPATLSEAVQNQIKRGLILQRPSASDRRVKSLELTALANTKLMEVRKILKKVEKQAIANVREKDLKSATQVLDLCIHNMQNLLESLDT